MTPVAFLPYAQLTLIESLVVTFLVLGLCVVLPLIAILTSHQRKMAEMFHRRERDVGNEAARLARLEQEVAMLRQHVHELVIRQDDRSRLSAPRAENETSVPLRLEPEDGA